MAIRKTKEVGGENSIFSKNWDNTNKVELFWIYAGLSAYATSHKIERKRIYMNIFNAKYSSEMIGPF